MIIERHLSRSAPSAALIGQKPPPMRPALAGRISVEAPGSPGMFLVSDSDGEPKLKLDMYDRGGQTLGQTAEPDQASSGAVKNARGVF
jgi:hypothetical protein